MMDMEWDDPTSWALSGLVTLMYAVFAFKASWFDTYPLMYKLVTLVLLPPVIYLVGYSQLNK